ncbi:hypothetical protein HZB02_02930 [Candidatus Woesearchaeota archaeon]|nr:hypothetical protein [Candidatus Woesearchaeota archaeon]
MNNLPFASQQFKSFYGRTIEQMPFLLAHGRLPMTPKQLLHERVYGTPQDREIFQSTYVDTACAVFHDPAGSGEAKVVLYSHPIVKELIHGLHQQSVIQNGSLVITPDQYRAVDTHSALVLSSLDLESFDNNIFSCPHIRQVFWEYIAEGDLSLVKEYQRVVKETSREIKGMQNSMGLGIYSATPGMRLLMIHALYSTKSNAFGAHLRNDFGLLIGEQAAEPPVVEKLPTLEHRV